MSKKAKLLAKLMSAKSDRAFTFDEAVQLLIHAGFAHKGGEGSHRVYRHADGRIQVLAQHGKEVKPIYIKQIRQLLT